MLPIRTKFEEYPITHFKSTSRLFLSANFFTLSWATNTFFLRATNALSRSINCCWRVLFIVLLSPQDNNVGGDRPYTTLNRVVFIEAWNVVLYQYSAYGTHLHRCFDSSLLKHLKYVSKQQLTLFVSLQDHFVHWTKFPPKATHKNLVSIWYNWSWKNM